jgi:hypothetical protein
MPVTVLQQTWGTMPGFETAALWRTWTPDLQHTTVNAGHLMA